MTEIQELLDGMDRQYNAMKTELLKLTWYMRGGVSINDLMYVYSWEDREILNKIIKENIEITEKVGLPLV